ncbi:MAG: hypothetical protein AAFQ53_09315, partial [Bacteroidota bacterium]
MFTVLFPRPAQAQKFEVEWDSLGGDPIRPSMDGVAVAPAIYGDTLLATSGAALYRLKPGQATFGAEFSEGINPAPGNFLEVTAAGLLLSEDPRVVYSTDGIHWRDAEVDEEMGFANDIHQTRHPANHGI